MTEIAKHDFYRPEGVTYQVCRACYLLKKLPHENEAVPCILDKHRGLLDRQVKPLLVPTDDRR